MDIVFTGPLHPHCLARERLGQDSRLKDEVRLGLAPETTTEQGDVHPDLVERYAQAFGDTLTGDLRAWLGAQASH